MLISLFSIATFGYRRASTKETRLATDHLVGSSNVGGIGGVRDGIEGVAHSFK